MTPAPEDGHRLRISIASTGRFHVLDLARELRARGHDVQFLAHVSPKRASSFGLAEDCVTPLMTAAAPWLAWQRLAPKLAPAWRKSGYFSALNRAVIRKLKPCDVFICMSGVYLEAAEHARKAFGAQVFLERASMHVEAQQAILETVKPLGRSEALTRDRELAGYRLASRIAVPSDLVAESFAHDPEVADKVVIVPYGVDLAMFPAAPLPDPVSRQALFVGTWSYQKGVDYLVEAVRLLGDVKLVHVGSLGDVPFPQDPNFIHHDPVDQGDLPKHYQDAGVLVLPSRQDGFGMVLLQALASGRPCVSSDHTGGPMIQAVWPALRDMVRVVPVGDVPGLASAIRAQIENPPAGMAAEDREQIGWAGYAARYESEILAALRADRTGDTT